MDRAGSLRRTFFSLGIWNFRLYFIGQAISLSGTWMQTIGQSWLVLQITGSGTALGFVTALQFLPILVFGPWGGVIADRFSKRTILYCTQCAAGVLALVLGVLVATGWVRLWMVAILAVCLGLVNAVDNPTRQTFVLEMVGKEQIQNAVPLNSVLVTSMNKPDGVLIKSYQVDRLLVFVDPTRDPKGAGYNLQQSKIAIGSGGLTGAGLGMGSQSRLNFIPERHTDFIFSVLGEQLGFAGAVMLLALYLALMASALSVSASSRDLFGALVAAGLISMWAFQILENMGMTIGMMPITGIPLPFMSYGSSFMVTNLAGVGMLLSIWSRRYGTTTT